MVTHQLQVERRTAKARRPKTAVLPLDHATNVTSVTAEAPPKSHDTQHHVRGRRRNPVTRRVIAHTGVLRCASSLLTHVAQIVAAPSQRHRNCDLSFPGKRSFPRVKVLREFFYEVLCSALRNIPRSLFTGIKIGSEVKTSYRSLYAVSGNKVPLYFCLWLCQMPTDFQNSFTDRRSSKLLASH